MTRALLASLMVSAIFSGHYLAAKVVLESIPAPSLAAARGLVGGIVLAVMFRKKLVQQFNSRRLFVLASVAALGFCGNQLLLFEGLARTTPTDAALISSVIPIVATLLAMAVGIDRVNPWRICGTGLGMSIVLWYLLRQQSVDLGQHAFGNALIFANVVCFCTALLLIKRFLHDLPSAAIATSMLTLGGAGLWLCGGDLGPVLEYSMSSSNAAALIIFETFVTTAVAYTLNLWALKQLSVATSTVFNYLQPPFTAVLAWIFLDQEPTAALGLAFFGIVLACVLVTMAERKTARYDFTSESGSKNP